MKLKFEFAEALPIDFALFTSASDVLLLLSLKLTSITLASYKSLLNCMDFSYADNGSDRFSPYILLIFSSSTFCSVELPSFSCADGLDRLIYF